MSPEPRNALDAILDAGKAGKGSVLKSCRVNITLLTHGFQSKETALRSMTSVIQRAHVSHF